MDVLAVVPARGGSSRLPGKNLAVLGGRTLVRRALDTALESGAFSTVALSSDDPRILAEANELPVTAIKRPPELAADTSPTVDAVMHTLDALESERGHRFDAVTVVQCTSPLTAPEDMVGAVEMLERTNAESVVSVVRLEGLWHPHKMQRLEGDHLVPFFPDGGLGRGQDLPAVYVRNAAIYVSQRDIIGPGRLLGDDIRGFVMPLDRSPDIDSEFDLDFARFLLDRAKRKDG